VYSIDSAIALMRALPMDEDPELVLRVVRKTLRSTGVSVEDIVASAQVRENALAASMADDRATIERLEREIVALRKNIDGSTAQLRETRSVRERLQDAITSESKVGMLLPPDEMARLQAEAAARRPPSASAKKETPSAPTPHAPPVPKPSAPPLPSKPGAPPPLKRSIAPKGPVALPSGAAPAPAPGPPPAPPSAPAPLADDDDDFSDVHNEPTRPDMAKAELPATPRSRSPNVASDDAPPDSKD
jgi:pilus assembly protein FimV